MLDHFTRDDDVIAFDVLLRVLLDRLAKVSDAICDFRLSSEMNFGRFEDLVDWVDAHDGRAELGQWFRENSTTAADVEDFEAFEEENFELLTKLSKFEF